MLAIIVSNPHEAIPHANPPLFITHYSPLTTHHSLLTMKNFFEFFGFLSAAGMSAVVIFLFIGKKEGLRSDDKDTRVSEYNISSEADMPDRPRAIALHPSKSSKSASRKEKAVQQEEERSQSASEQLKNLYDDAEFVSSTAKQWKSTVRDIAEDYNVRPQVLLAHVLVQSYIGNYSKSQLKRDAGQHAGEQIKSVSAALKSYPYGWSMQKLMQQYDLMRYFPEEVPVASASLHMMPEKKMTPKTVSKGTSKPTAQPAASAVSPAEDGFRNMVAKEYGFSSWTGLQRLADPETKTEAQKRVKRLMLAARIK